MLVRIVLSILLSLGFGFLTQPLQAQAVLDTVCAGARGVNYQVLENAGSTYNWNVKGGVIADGNGFHKISIDWGKDTGLFLIEVIQYSQHGCPADTVRAFVWIRPGIDIRINGPKEICEGDEILLEASGADKMRWSFGYSNPKLLIRPKESKEYTIIGYSEACGMDTASIYVRVNKRPNAGILINPTDPKLGEIVNFYVDGTSGTESFWSIQNGAFTAKGEQAQHIFPKSGNYSVQLVVIDPNGCADTAYRLFQIDANPQVFIPNAFTPNGDGLNDQFQPEVSDVDFVRLSIFNRWGERIFEGENSSASWDGTFKGALAEDGVYVYYDEAIGIDDKKYVYNGTVTMLR